MKEELRPDDPADFEGMLDDLTEAEAEGSKEEPVEEEV